MPGVGTPAAKVDSIKLGDLTFHRLGYGAMRTASPHAWGWTQASRGGVQGAAERTYDLGHTFFDTADNHE